MIAKGNLHGNGAKLVAYILTAEKGERVEFGGSRGFDTFSSDLREAARLMQDMAELTTNCQKPWFHTQTRLAPGEHLSKEQWEQVLDREEKRLGFTGLPRVWSFHIDEATGERHLHGAWFRIDPETERAVDPGLFKLRLKELSRTLEKEFALREVSNHRQTHDRAPIAERNEVEESRRLGTDVRAIRTAILDCLEQSDGGKAFQAALDAEGLVLANGDRRDCFVVIDPAGGQHALNKKLTGQTLAHTRERLADLDRTQLPGVAQAQEIQAERQAAREQEVRQREKHGGEREEARAGAARGAYAPLQAEAAHQETKAAKPLGKTAGEIRLAWSLTDTAAQFAQRLEEKGLILIYVTAEEARASERAHDFAKAVGRQNRALREGFAVVDSRGAVTRIDQRVTGEQWEEIQKRLGGIERGELLTVAQAREVMRETNRAAWTDEREKVRPASFIENGIAECAGPQPAIVFKDANGVTVSEVELLTERGERKIEPKFVYGAEAFAARVEEAGIAIARVTPADSIALDALRHDAEMKRTAAETNRESYQGNRFAEVEAGELAAVMRNGDVHRINAAKLGEAGQYLAGELPSITEARARFEIEHEQKSELYDLRRAEAGAEREAFATMREQRAEGAHTAQHVREAEHDFVTAVDTGTRTAKRVLAGATKIFETGFNLLFGWAMAPPKLTPQQAHDQARAENNVETVHAREYAAAERENEVAHDWQAHAQKTAQQEKDLRLAQTLGLPATAEATSGREHDRGRDRDDGRELELER